MALRATPLFRSADLQVQRVACDGLDPCRPREEAFTGDRLVLVLRGDFHLHHPGGRGFVDVRTALLARGDQPFVMAHPRGRGDLCLSFAGPAVRRLLDDEELTGARLVATTAARLSAARRLAADDGLGWQTLLAEVVAAPGDARPAHEARPSRADRQIAEAIGYVIAARFDEQLPLADLARAAAVSPHHACRAFRRATGTTIHRWLEELRLSHALAALLDGEGSIAGLAHDVGFANHGHLSNRFRARFGAAPSQVRATALLAAEVSRHAAGRGGRGCTEAAARATAARPSRVPR